LPCLLANKLDFKHSQTLLSLTKRLVALLLALIIPIAGNVATNRTSKVNRPEKIPMSDEAPRKLTVEDLVRSQQQTQEAIQKISEQLGRMNSRNWRRYGGNAYSVLFKVFGVLAMFIAWICSAEYGPTPLLIFISFVLMSIATEIHDFPRISNNKYAKLKQEEDELNESNARARKAQWENVKKALFYR
jgi:hypothetical protein